MSPSNVTRVEEQIVACDATIDEQETLVRVAELHLGDVGDMRAAALMGEGDPAAVDEHERKYTLQRSEALAELERQQALRQALARRLEDATRTRTLEALSVTQAEIDAATERIATAGRAIRGQLAAAAKEAVKITRARAEIDGLIEDSRRDARIAGLEFAASLADEPAWLPEGWEALVALMQGEPDPLLIQRLGQTFAYVGGGPRIAPNPLRPSEVATLAAIDARVTALAKDFLGWARVTPDETDEAALERLLKHRGASLELASEVVARRNELVTRDAARVDAWNEKGRSDAETQNVPGPVEFQVVA